MCSEKVAGSVEKRLWLHRVQLIVESAKTARTGPRILVIRSFGIRSAVIAIAIV